MKFDTIYDGLIKGTEKLALVGLGAYVFVVQRKNRK